MLPIVPDRQDPDSAGTSTAIALGQEILAANKSDKVSDEVVIKAMNSYFALPEAKDGEEEIAFGGFTILGLKDFIAKANPTVVANILKPNFKNSKTVWRAAEQASARPQIAAAFVPQLTEALKDPNPAVRNVAAVALGEAGPEAKEAAPLLARVLRTEKDEQAKESMAQALGQIGVSSPEIIEVLIQIVAEGSLSSMYAEKALEALQFDPAPYLSNLVLCANRQFVPQVVLDQFTRIGGTAVPPILESARQKAVDKTRNECEMLIAVGEPAVPLLTPLLKSKEPRDRRIAITSLAGIRNKKGDDSGWLIPFLKDSENHVRHAAIISYTESQAPMEAKLKVLQEALSSQDEIAEGIAWVQLGDIGPPAAPLLPQLTALMMGKKDKARIYAMIILLIDIHHPEARSIINAILKSDNKEQISSVLSTMDYYPKILASFLDEVKALNSRPDATNDLRKQVAYLLRENRDDEEPNKD